MLTRQCAEGDVIQIGDATLTIHWIHPESRKVRLSIDAPAEVPITRLERIAPIPPPKGRQRREESRRRRIG